MSTMNKVRDIVEAEGRKYHSDFVVHSVGAEPRDRFKDDIFPIGGHPLGNAKGAAPFEYRRKFFESYQFSDPNKTGR